MGWLETQPMRRFEVATPPRDAVRFVIDQLRPRGFSLETWDLDSVLAERGPWTGVVLREGSQAANFAVGAFFEVFPLVLALPWTRHQHGRVRMAVIARPLHANMTGSELICWNFSLDSVTVRYWATNYTVDVMEDLAAPPQAAGLLLAGPAKPSNWNTWKALPADHPLYPQQWRIISREARRRGCRCQRS